MSGNNDKPKNPTSNIIWLNPSLGKFFPSSNSPTDDGTQDSGPGFTNGFVKIGNDYETGKPVTIGDTERRSGLYILGKPGMGKSTLMVNLMLQDIKNGHGLFFLDPHGDAIVDLKSRVDLNRLKKDLHILDPTDEKYSIGINLLFCKNRESLTERTAAYTRARNVLFKIFEKEFGDWGLWVQDVLQKILHVFIENPQYTLADVPLFLVNSSFRNKLLGNLEYNQDAVDYWQNEYREQEGHPLFYRIRILLDHPYVKNILSQPETTFDFADIMEHKRIMLVKLGAYLPSDIKKFIGTIFISELAYAATLRPDDKRHQFCVYVDEFQNFSSSEDFSTLFTQARKYGIATTIAHQERFGQFLDNQVISGA